VMGGRSASIKTLTKNSLQFEGNVSLENNGGFASLRSPWGKFDYSNYTKMTMRFKGTNRKFAVTMATSPRFYEPNFKYFFEPNPDEWQTLTFNLEDFKTHQMGRSTGEKITNEDLAKIIRLGIILYDKKAGDFELEIDYIKFK
jgi:NADH dehydrogenase [ubiquinone] 1 alpha subcomplex assembly factor 1